MALTPSTPISLSPPLPPLSPCLESRMESLSLCSQLDLGVNLPSLHYSPTALSLPPHLPTPPLLNLSIKKRHSSTSRKERKVRPYQACKPSREGSRHQMRAIVAFHQCEDETDSWTAGQFYRKEVDHYGWDLYHDALGCLDCWTGSEFVYCIKSHYNVLHPLHKCLGGSCPCSF